MSIRRPARIGLPVLLLALGVTSGCKSIPQPPEVTTAGMRIDVERARQKRQTVEVSVRIWNDHDQRVSFEHGNVRLIYGDREVSAKPFRTWRRGNPSIQAKSNLDYRWAFEMGEELPAGNNYTIEIRDLMLDDVPAGDTAVFQIAL